jgi:hypothetical protein
MPPHAAKISNAIFNLFQFRRDNSVKNYRTITKFDLEVRIPLTHLHVQFNPCTYIPTKVREWKLKFLYFFS